MLTIRKRPEAKPNCIHSVFLYHIEKYVNVQSRKVGNENGGKKVGSVKSKSASKRLSSNSAREEALV